MEKLMFLSDYMEGCHIDVLKKLNETNMESTSGYGTDKYTLSAKKKINDLLEEDNDIYFLLGGTETNQVVIDKTLRTYEGVISVDTAHIVGHEAGAIEFGGHKVIMLPNHDGKLSSLDLDKYMINFYKDSSYPHMVQPKMVYISNPTECGTLYTKKELEDIRNICDKYNLYFYCDGARLAYALASTKNDVSFKEFAKFFDAFYIGGTKCGLLFGEAVVLRNDSLKQGFFTTVKQHGALLAKGRILGVQFDALFTDDLYFKIGSNAIKCANILKNGFKELGYKEYIDSPTNQLFIIIDNDKYEKLKEYAEVTYWGIYDDNNTIIRFVTSWATKDDDCYKLLNILKEL